MAALKAPFRSPKGYLALTMRRRSSRPALALLGIIRLFPPMPQINATRWIVNGDCLFLGSLRPPHFGVS